MGEWNTNNNKTTNNIKTNFYLIEGVKLVEVGAKPKIGSKVTRGKVSVTLL